MMNRSHFVFLSVVAITAASLHAATLEPIRENCAIGIGDKPGTFRLQTGKSECGDFKHCGSSMSDESFGRFTGITVADLARNGAQLTATLAAEAGKFTCAGTVANGLLRGESIFTPDADFVARMGQMGFTGYDSDKLLACAFLDVQSGWARSLKDAGIAGLNIDNLIGLRVFNVDPAYARSIAALGYPLPDADQLVSLKCQGVNAAEVREIRALGYQPSLDELVQIRIFKITPDFIHRMQDRGLKDLTIAKLVQIRIFKLAE